ncbi:MAG: hypothetical protein GXP35_10350 [Actinobacteria bacterium]|nr:hypothetical protein [Actinomycetota bacterium]
MSTLAHVFEAGGIATVTIGLVREQIVSTAPPRGLWCDFPLGQSLGRPGDAAFQHRVLEHAFSLLKAEAPVFEEFAEPVRDDGTTVMSCTLPPRYDPDVHPAVDEARGLRPAYDRALERFGNRIGPGRAIDADTVVTAVEAFARVAEGTPWEEAGIPGVPGEPGIVSRVSLDVRGYYEMAALALSDHAPESWAGVRWFLNETETGKVLREVRAKMRDSGAEWIDWFFVTPADASDDEVADEHPRGPTEA